jgi:hypothetical protein
MRIHEVKKTNHLAVAGFLLPFVAAGAMALLFLWLGDDSHSLAFLVPYWTLIPLVLIAGLVASLKSIPLIEECNDKDYAYSGLTLNILFIFFYLISLIYFLS